MSIERDRVLEEVELASQRSSVEIPQSSADLCSYEEALSQMQLSVEKKNLAHLGSFYSSVWS